MTAMLPSHKEGWLEKVDPKNAHLALSHGYPSPAVRPQQVRSQHKNYP
ncbi:unnamed protein product [Schistosoma curassoni]|uniref:Uncharacterized protein n=1 Tax=Schistosoma curassoni TaxID=6186 RepID=A0A183KXU9_9TREM|nr:unnamed protein product [Schistosoma curassoni]